MPASSSAVVRPDPAATPSPTTRHLREGLEHYGAGRTREAVEAFQHGVAASEGELSAAESGETLSQLHEGLGDAARLNGDHASAAAHYEAALRAAPHLVECWFNFGNVQFQAGKHQEAIALYLQALKLNWQHTGARSNLLQALMATRQFIFAKALLFKLKAESPWDGRICFQLGKVHFELNELDLAMDSFRQAVALNPQDAESVNWIGALKQAMGDTAGAQAAYEEAARIQPLITRPAAKSPAEFRLLALYAPFGGNTPTEYLFQDAFFDTDTLALLTSRQYDAELFGQNVQLVINLISDADQTEALLPVAADLADRFGRPMINHPRKILRTTRDAIAVLLQGIPNCRIPKAVRVKAGADRSEAALRGAFPFSSSVLARPVGTHGGDDFEKIENYAALAAFLSQRPDQDHYLIEYIDYCSADGFFRKYRFIFIDDEILPYHLCIGDEWKLHHVNTDMANQPWMQKEEEAFLNDPAAVFTPAHYQAMQIIRQRIGLEYWGIDCALDASGNLVLFEANASMLVHARNEGFLYKTPAVSRIKAAFDAMLRKYAGSRQDA
jgi:tetratricopeptide (TPR) repeat protein